MSFWQRLLHALGFRSPPRPMYEVDERVYQSLQALAELEQRPEEAVAADLLAQAMARAEAEQEILRIWDTLTPREQQVTVLICRNYTNQQIASQLVISTETAKSHVQRALRKFGVHNRAELRLLLAGYEFHDSTG